MNLRVDVDGIAEVHRRLHGLELNLVDPEEALIVAVDVIADANLTRLEKGVRPKLAKSTLARKKRHGQPSTPLLATGHLFRSLKPGGPQNILRARNGAVRFGTSDYVANFHQKAKKGGTHPRRSVITGGGKKVKAAAADAAREHLLPTMPGQPRPRLRSLGTA